MASKLVITGGKIYRESKFRLVITSGKIFRETIAVAPPAGGVNTDEYYRRFLLSGANF